jgi:hypothetical protein
MRHDANVVPSDLCGRMFQGDRNHRVKRLRLWVLVGGVYTSSLLRNPSVTYVPAIAVPYERL